MTSLRSLQTLTAGAALFAILGACGLAPARSAPRPIVRPHPPRGDLTVRSLTGRWVGVRQTPDAVETLTLSLVQSGVVTSARENVTLWAANDYIVGIA